MHNLCCKQASRLIFVILSLASDNNCTDGDIRLVGGSTSSEGIVEMCLGGHYGYICQDKESTDDKEGILTCEQLGYDPAGECSVWIYMLSILLYLIVAISAFEK